MKEPKLKILVTGVGSELAFSVIKALQISSLDYELIGTDIYQEVIGKYWCEKFYVISPVSNKETYLAQLMNIIEVNGVDIIIPTIDQELFVLPQYKQIFKDQYGCHLLINDKNEIDLFSDKWKAYLWFKEKKHGTPASYLVPDFLKENGLKKEQKFIIKPRFGGGSRHIYIFETNSELVNYSEIVPEPMIQNFLGQDEEEYTATVFRSSKNEIVNVLFKRKLKFGMTNQAELVINNELSEFVNQVIFSSQLKGSNNIQFRLTENGPKILEINPRFSGTAGIRANFGFNDVEFWIRDVLNLPLSLENIKLKEGFVLRFMEEQYHFKN